MVTGTAAPQGIAQGVNQGATQAPSETLRTIGRGIGKGFRAVGKRVDKQFRQSGGKTKKGKKTKKGNKGLTGLVEGTLKPMKYGSTRIGNADYTNIPLNKNTDGVPRVADVSYERVPITIGGIGEGQPAILLVPTGMSPITESPKGELAISSGNLSTPLAVVPVANPELLQPSRIVYIQPQTHRVRYVPMGSMVK